MTRRNYIYFFLLMILSTHALSADIPTPKDTIGFEVGADYKLARWEQIIDYFKMVGSQSDRVVVDEIGRSTEDNPYIMATISSPDVIKQRDKYQAIQQKISHPGGLSEVEKQNLLKKSKSVILISCALHSNEIASSQMAMELLYELATKNDPKTKEILDNTIVLLVPSANPDGINKIIDWYESSLGKPWEGSGMPWLYQKYCGHDNNRDWFMLSQKESRILTKVLYHQWYPGIIYDIHQMGSSGCRFFVPPFFDPISPNVDPLIHESLKLIGGAMASQFAAEGKRGIISNAIYDNWWHGGNRTTPYRHNIVGLLTEAASPRVASPIFQRESELSGHSRGLPKYTPQVNFADPWPGGWWRLRDVVEYEKSACYALFTLGARYRAEFNRNYMAMGEKAIRLGKEEPPYAYLVSPEQRDFSSAIRMLQILHLGGIEVDIAQEPFNADGIEYPKGTYVIYAAQPYRNHIRDLLDPQDYPDRKQYPGGPAEAPYDMAGWTLSYQMGVTAVRIKSAFEAKTQHLDSIEQPKGSITGNGNIFLSSNQTTNDFIMLNRALKKGIHTVVLKKQKPNKKSNPSGAIAYLPKKDSVHWIKEWAEELGLHIQSMKNIPSGFESIKLEKPRIALYQPWTASMDEGWTRFTLEQFEFDYASLHNTEIQAGQLNQRYDVILIPDLGTSSILNGRKANTTAPQYIGGVGEEGVAQLQKFVANGGRLLCLDSSTAFAIKYFDLPVKNVLRGLKSTDFYCPGSILRIRLNKDQSIAYGMDQYAGACFKHSFAYEATEIKKNLTGLKVGKPIVSAAYDNTLPLMSGWVLGSHHLHGKAAIMTVPYGEGDIVLYGFRVQNRAQTHGTYRLLFNGLLY